MVCLDLRQLLGNGGVLNVQASETGKGLFGPGEIPLLDQVSRCFGQEEHASYKDESPQKLHRNRDAVAASVIAVFAGIVDDSGQ